VGKLLLVHMALDAAGAMPISGLLVRLVVNGDKPPAHAVVVADKGKAGDLQTHVPSKGHIHHMVRPGLGRLLSDTGNRKKEKRKK